MGTRSMVSVPRGDFWRPHRLKVVGATPTGVSLLGFKKLGSVGVI